MNKKIEEMRAERVILEKIAILDKFKKLIILAINAMKAHRAFKWAKAKKQPTEKELGKQAEEKRKQFVDALKEIPSKYRREWAQSVQLAYIRYKAGPQIFYYLGEEIRGFLGLGRSLKESADEYVYGWKLLGYKNREELPGPIHIISPYGLGLPVTDDEGILGVQHLIAKLKKGNGLQKKQAEIIEALFEKVIARLGKKMPEKGFTLGDVVNEVLDNNA
ncbi:hypothetical protein KJ671_01275 [Patescibacteria group bacterium]|nr:hypothetical protein [Patescibacteria group bacterium]